MDNLPVTEENFKALEKRFNEDTNVLLGASNLLIHAEKENSELRKEVERLKNEVLILKGFVETNLATYEGIDDDDENILSYEHKADYIQQATYFKLRYGRQYDRIDRMKEYNDNY